MGRSPQRLPELIPPDVSGGRRPWWRSRRRRRRALRVTLRCLLLAALAFVLIDVACALVVGGSVWRAAREGRTALVEGSRAVVRKDAGAARAEFADARRMFAAASDQLDAAWVLPLRITPIASTHVGVATALNRIGGTVADAGLAVADAMEALPDQQLTMEEGRIDLGHVRTAARALSDGVRAAAIVGREIDGMPGGWVGGPLAEPRREALATLPSVIDGVRKAEAALSGLPGLLGEGGRKRYLVAFSNLAELRGSGGLFGYVTSLTAADGDLDLDDLSGRPTRIFPAPGEVGLDYPPWFPSDFRTQAELFQNINMTTDFPTVGGFVLQTAEAEWPALDGVIAVDPIGIGAVLGLTGPIRVPSWPGEISAENVAKIAMHDVYVDIEDNDRREQFFGQVVRTAFGRLVSARITLTPGAVGAFDGAVRGGHFRMFSEHPQDQTTFERIGASGGVRRASDATDVLSVVSENAVGNKSDWFLRREIRYRVRLDPDSGDASTALAVALRNQAPSSGLPDYVIGSPLSGIEKGTNRQIVMFVRAPTDALDSFVVDGNAASSTPASEGVLRAYRTTVDIPSGSHVEVGSSSRVRAALRRTGGALVYRLQVLRQAVANPDFVDIEIEVPRGYRANGVTTYLGDLTQDVSLEVRLVRTARGSLVDRFVRTPWRAITDALRRVV